MASTVPPAAITSPRESARESVERSCAAQGLTVELTDVDAARKVAVLLTMGSAAASDAA